MKNKQQDISKRVDWITILLYAALVITGWFNIFAAVYNDEANQIFDISQKYGKQMLWIIASVIIAISIVVIDSKIYSASAFPFYVLMMITLVGVYLIAPEVKGARSWFEIGSFRFQPSEFAKIATSLLIARILSGYGVKITTFKTLFQIGLVLLIPMALIVIQGDAGSSLVFFSFLLVFYREGLSGWVLVIAFYIALIFSFTILYGAYAVGLTVIVLALLVFYIISRNERIQPITFIYVLLAFLAPWLAQYFIQLDIPEISPFAVGLLVLLIPAIIFIYKKKSKIIFFIYFATFISIGFIFSVNYVFNNILEQHQKSRLRVFYGMESDPLGLEFNVNQSKIAIGSGDFLGKGFLNGTQTKNNFVPEQSTDFIFCTIGEEWGFVGSTVVIIAFILLLTRILFLAEKQRSLFSRIYGYCVASILFFHFVINIGMTIGLMPVIGIPLPFFSYGGSSLWGFTILLFIFIKLDSDRDVLIQ